MVFDFSLKNQSRATALHSLVLGIFAISHKNWEDKTAKVYFKDNRFKAITKMGEISEVDLNYVFREDDGYTIWEILQ